MLKLPGAIMKKHLYFILILITFLSCETKPYWANRLPKEDNTYFGVGYNKQKDRDAAIEKALFFARENLAKNIAKELSKTKKKDTRIVLSEEEADKLFTLLKEFLQNNDELTGVTRVQGDEDEDYYYVMTQINKSELKNLIYLLDLEEEFIAKTISIINY